MKCHICGETVTIRSTGYSCKCITVPKVILGKEITPEIAEELFTNKQTRLLEGFISRNKKQFKAALTIENGKIKFLFSDTPQKETSDQSTYPENLVKIRVHSSNSGSAYITIKGAVYKEFHVNYGHVSTRMAECLATLTAANLIKHITKKSEKIKLEISINNIEFSRYILKERTPRDKEMKQTLERLFDLLSEFDSWVAKYEPQRRAKLMGTPQSKEFPKGIFPWLHLELTEEPDHIQIVLPQYPDVKAQLIASIQRLHQEEEWIYRLPKTAKSVLMAWIANVRKE